jgi:hypothetical protein
MAGTLDLISCYRSTDRLYHHSGISGTDIESYHASGDDVYACAWDGTNLYYLDNVTDTVKKLDVSGGWSSATVVGTVALGYQARGIEMVGGDLIVANESSGAIKQYDGFTTTVLSTWTLPGSNHDGDITWDEINGYLLSCKWSGLAAPTVHRYVGFTTTEVDSITLPTSLSGTASAGGIAWINGNLVVARTTGIPNDNIEVYSGFSTTMTTNFTAESTQTTGLGWLYDPDEFGVPGEIIGEDDTGATIYPAPERLPHHFSDLDFTDPQVRRLARMLEENFNSVERQLLALDPEQTDEDPYR